VAEDIGEEPSESDFQRAQDDDLTGAASAARPATIVDVAKAAFVSPTTASLAISGRKGVAEATRQQVLEAARKLNYRPNLTARALRGGATGPVGIVIDSKLTENVGEVSRLFIHRLLHELNTGLSKRGVPVIYIEPGSTQVLSALSVLLVLGERVLSDELASQLQHYPVISAGRQAPNDTYSLVNYQHDHDAYAHNVVSHLVDQGATRLAVVCDEEAANYSRAGSAAVARAATQAGLPHQILESPFSPGGVQKAVGEAINGGADGLFVMFPFPGSALTAIRDLGLTTPDDVLVVGRAEGTIEAEVYPHMSALSMEAIPSAAIILDALEQLIDGRSPAEKTLPHRLITRESSLRHL
jgi:DNA-binding LacI/PurR family transcriptional regulator